MLVHLPITCIMCCIIKHYYYLVYILAQAKDTMYKITYSRLGT